MRLLHGKLGGLVAFLGIAALVIGGLGWVTREALSMEEERRVSAIAREQEKLQKEQNERWSERTRQAQVERAEKMHLALMTLDSRLTPALAREDSRPYPQYLALYSPFPALQHTGVACLPGEFYLPSPLLTAELPEWMLLHFQVDPVKGWISPQVIPEETQKMLRRQPIELALHNVDDIHKQRLDELKAAYPTKQFLVAMRERGFYLDDKGQLNPYDLTNLGNGFNYGQNGFNTQPQQQQQAPYQAANGGIDNNEPNRRFQNSSRAMNEGIWAYLNDTRNFDQATSTRAIDAKIGEIRSFEKQLSGNGDATSKKEIERKLDLLKKDVEELHKAAQQPVEVEFGTMKPIWLPNHEQPKHLLMVRPARVGSRLVLQGILLDWSKLQEILKGAIEDVFPNASLVPLAKTDPARLDKEMYVLPLELEPGPLVLPDQPEPIKAAEPQPAGWTPLRIGLVTAWVAALVALIAVGLGGWTLLDLSERRIRFVSAVTHELRTPLTTLRLYLDLLNSGMVSEAKQRDEYIRTLGGEADRLYRLIGNVLDFARLENARPKIEKRPVSVAEILQQLLGTWNECCAGSGKELQISNTLPSDMTISTDRNLVEQILGNLIDNARKYSQDASDPRIVIRTLHKENKLVFEVEDRGPGVTKRERGSIFRPFRRGLDADVKAGGVGLGLALATRWSDFIGGRLSVASGEGGVGACFRLELPIAVS